MAVLNRALHSYRLATADPHVHGVGRRDALVARLGYGAGEEVADGLWTDARELIDAGSRRRRRRMPAAAGPPGRAPHRPPCPARLRGARAARPARPRRRTRRARPRSRSWSRSTPRSPSCQSDPAAPALADRLRRAAGVARRGRGRGAVGARGRIGQPCRVARRSRSRSGGSRPRSGRGRRRFRDSQSPSAAEDGLELVDHVAAQPHRGAAVERRRAPASGSRSGRRAASVVSGSGATG